MHISHKWKFIFVRQPKSSSTAIMVAIKSQLCGLVDGVGECAPDEFTSANDVTDEQWRDYFVFTVVRNPWIRMLSAHTMFTKHFLRLCAPPSATRRML